MKIRMGFVSNSSSTAFIITNLSDVVKSLVDFVEENPQLLEEYNERFDYDVKPEDLLESARQSDVVFAPRSPRYCVFGDEDRTVIGRVFDYILREGGKSASFEWRFEELLR